MEFNIPKVKVILTKGRIATNEELETALEETKERWKQKLRERVDFSLLGIPCKE